MNEYLVLGGIITVFCAFFLNKIIEFYREKEENMYRIQKKKLHITRKTKKDHDDEDEDFEDFEDSLPPWLEGIFEGAGINVEKFYNQDPVEMEKLKKIVDRIPGRTPGENHDLIG